MAVVVAVDVYRPDTDIEYLTGQLLVRWDGAQWHRVDSPTPPGGVILNAVAAVSATSAWAVGSVGGFAEPRTLILRWNGTRWRPVPSPTPPRPGF